MLENLWNIIRLVIWAWLLYNMVTTEDLGYAKTMGAIYFIFSIISIYMK